MKSFFFFVVLSAVCFSISAAQQDSATSVKVVHFKKLQEFLPSLDVKGFKRGKPIGATESSSGMSMSEASVRYATEPGENDTVQQQTIEIKIVDMSQVPGWAQAYQLANFERETEDGYEKSVSVKGYKGIEKAQTGDSKSCSLNFAVGTRFNVSLEGSGFQDIKMLNSLVDSMDLAELEKTTGE